MKQFGGASSFDAYAAPLPTPPGGRGGGVRERYLIESPHLNHAIALTKSSLFARLPPLAATLLLPASTDSFTLLVFQSR